MKKAYRQKKIRLISKALLVFVVLVLLVIIGVTKLAWAPGNSDGSPTNEFNKSMHSLNNASSLWVVVNKGRKLPSSFEPKDLKAPAISLRLPGGSSEMLLRSEAAGALEQLFAAADKEKVPLMLASAYRSYAQQQGLHSIYVKQDGQIKAELSSARAGHSEHQTGLAADVGPKSRKCEVEPCFADLPEGKWLAANAHKHGYIIRYLEDKQDLTGYEYEPWHIRYVGLELARKLYDSNQTMEQFFGLDSHSNYPAQPHQLLE